MLGHTVSLWDTERKGMMIVSVDDALNSLLGTERTGNLEVDLIAAAMETMRRRERNSIDGGLVLGELINLGLSYRDIERLTGIPRATAQRWATPPPRVGH